MERTSRQDGFWKGFSIVLLIVLVAVVGLMYFQSTQPRYVYHDSKSSGATRQLASLTTPFGNGTDIYWVADLADRALPFVVNITTNLKPSDKKKEAAADDGQTQKMLEEMQQMLPFGQQFDFRQMQPPAPREGKVGEGSGFIIREDGYVVTNSHVIASGDSFIVRTNDGKEYEAELVGNDEFKDIGVLKIKGGGKFTAAVLGESTKTRIGEPVIAIGSPLGLKASVTAGIISTTERSLTDIGVSNEPRMPQKYLQTDAAINRGNSGGPLINSHGEVIGINQAIVRWDGNAAWTEGGMVPIEGIGFAIPIDEVKATITQIVEHGKVVYPGISAGIVSVKYFLEENQNVKLKVDKGVYVQAVTVDGPAAKAGIQVNDVIVSINGKPVETAEELITEIGKHKVGDRVRLRVARAGGDNQEDVSVVLGALDFKNRPR
jgi:S1-C subfamily serine protease